jgi:hypothetical protein
VWRSGRSALYTESYESGTRVRPALPHRSAADADHAPGMRMGGSAGRGRTTTAGVSLNETWRRAGDMGAGSGSSGTRPGAAPGSAAGVDAEGATTGDAARSGEPGTGTSAAYTNCGQHVHLAHTHAVTGQHTI